MDPRTGEIYYAESQEELKELAKKMDTEFIPLSEDEVKELKPMSKRRRLFLMRGKPCPCLSGKSFKKCCWKKYKKKGKNKDD